MSIIERKQFSDLLGMRYVSDTLRYTLYVGPHYTVTGKSGSEDEDPLYVKHFFIGDKRIAVRVAKLSSESSVLGNFDEEDMAGQSIVTGGIDYAAKRVAQEQVIAACYDSLQYAYLPVDRRAMVNMGMVPTGVDCPEFDEEESKQRGTANPDTEWKKVYYYSSDHIGSILEM